MADRSVDINDYSRLLGGVKASEPWRDRNHSWKVSNFTFRVSKENGLCWQLMLILEVEYEFNTCSVGFRSFRT